MILGDLQNWKNERRMLHPVIGECLRYLHETDFHSLSNGEYAIEGEKIRAIVQEVCTAEPSELKAEAHLRHADIQYLIRGEEIIGVAPLTPHQPVIEDRSEDKDAIFYGNIQNEYPLILREGMFAVLFPWDIHRPCCQVSSSAVIRKVVIKIDMNLLS